MISKRRTQLMALAAMGALWTASTDANAVDVLSNGSFESNNADTIYAPGWDGLYRIGEEVNQLNGWTFNTGHGKWLLKEGNAFDLGSASDGEFFLNVTGTDPEAENAQFNMSQTFAVVDGETYTVLYDLARRPGGADTAEISINVGEIGLSHSAFSLGDGTENPATYHTFQFQFVAAGDSATITILGPTGEVDNGFYLDNIRVDGMAVPEPASLVLMGAGTMLLLRRRRASVE